MAQQPQTNTYTQGYSAHTVAGHQQRTAESEAAFLLPFIRKTDHILDAGCGPGTITTGLAALAPDGHTTGIDISPTVFAHAAALAASTSLPASGPGSVSFQPANVLAPLPFPDATFDVVFANNLFAHLPPPDAPLAALAELRRVLKPGGVLATRDALAQHFFPQSLGLERLWVGNSARALGGGTAEAEPTAERMPRLVRAAGFKEVRVGAGAVVVEGEGVRAMAERAEGRLGVGDAFRESWVVAGIGEGEIEETVRAVREWKGREDAWYVSVMGEVLAWK